MEVKKFLHISGKNYNKGDLNSILYEKNIKSITIYIENNYFLANDVFNFSRKIYTVESVSIYGKYPILNFILNFPKLRNLYLNNVIISKNSLSDKCDNILDLWLENCEIGSYNFLKNITYLKDLTIYKCDNSVKLRSENIPITLEYLYIKFSKNNISNDLLKGENNLNIFKYSGKLPEEFNIPPNKILIIDESSIF